MKNTLLSLQTRRTSLTIIITDILEERATATEARKKELDQEKIQYERKLMSVILDLGVISCDVDNLNEHWNKKNVSNKPVTVI